MSDPVLARLVETGRSYQALLASYDRLIEAVLEMTDQIPSFTVGERRENELEFSYLGVRQSIRFTMRRERDGRWVGNLVRLQKEPLDDASGTFGARLTIDGSGAVGLPGRPLPWRIPRDAVLVLALLLGVDGGS